MEVEPTSIAIVVIIIGLGVLAIGMFKTSKNSATDEEVPIGEVPVGERLFLLQKESTRHLKSIASILRFFLWLTILSLFISFIYWLATPSLSYY